MWCWWNIDDDDVDGDDENKIFSEKLPLQDERWTERRKRRSSKRREVSCHLQDYCNEHDDDNSDDNDDVDGDDEEEEDDDRNANDGGDDDGRPDRLHLLKILDQQTISISSFSELYCRYKELEKGI